jgi:two-component system, cell cycle response regulator DivK
MPAKILYIEDNPFNLRLVKKMLEMGGYEMLGAGDGLTGLKIAQEQQPDLILLDMNLPDIDGIQVFHKVRNELKMTMPVIALTANAMYGDRERFLNVGCNDYLSKPIDRRELLDTVARYINVTAKTEPAQPTIAAPAAQSVETASKPQPVQPANVITRRLQPFQTDDVSENKK